MVGDMNDRVARSQAVSRLKEIVARADNHRQPFLYYLPQLLDKPELSLIDPAHAVKFAEIARKYDALPLVKDALKILNQTVNPDDGSLREPARDIFYDNQSFFWNELGNHTKATDIISHILQKTAFIIAVSKQG
jgi:hypothetical protein